MARLKPVQVSARDKLAAAVVPTQLGANGGDVMLEAVPVEAVIAGAGAQVAGWPPPWMGKAGSTRTDCWRPP